jgi:hypothetical protein
VTIEQVEDVELLEVTLDDKLSWSSHIDKVVVVMMGRCLSVIKKTFCVFDTKMTVLDAQALILSHLD